MTDMMTPAAPKLHNEFIITSQVILEDFLQAVNILIVLQHTYFSELKTLALLTSIYRVFIFVILNVILCK